MSENNSLQPVAYQYRFYDFYKKHWTDWIPVEKWIASYTTSDNVDQIQRFIDAGMKFQLRALYAEIPNTWNHAGRFYNAVAHALMDIHSPESVKFRLNSILEELEQLINK